MIDSNIELYFVDEAMFTSSINKCKKVWAAKGENAPSQ